MWVSYAYILGTLNDRQIGKSLIYIKKKRGPRIVPCGTPHLRVVKSERQPLTDHRWVRFVKYDLTFNDHVTVTAASCMWRLGPINHFKHCFDNRSLILIINAFSPQCGVIHHNLTLPNSKLSRTLPVKLLTGPKKNDHVGNSSGSQLNTTCTIAIQLWHLNYELPCPRVSIWSVY